LSRKGAFFMDTDMVKILERFQNLIPPLTHHEFAQLEANIIKEGCRDAIVTWHDYIIDGHNRFEICQNHDIPFKTMPLDFANEEEVENWIDSNQLGRRNLNPDQMKLIRGRIYNREKKQHGGDRKSKAHFAPLKTTAEKQGEKFGVNQATIKRDAQFARAVDKTKPIAPGLEKNIIQGKNKIPAKDVVEAAKIMDEQPEVARAILTGEKSIADVKRENKRQEVIENLENIQAKKAKEIQGVYDVIVIDPPWDMKKIERDERPNQSEFDYPTMTIDELRGLKIPYAQDCHVWTWTTQKYLPVTFDLLNSWSIKYVCTFVWHKPGGFQPFGLPQYNIEFIVYGRYGTPKFIDTKKFFLGFKAPRTEHSEKPEIFYQVVRRVTAGRRLDMFNRREIDGFDRWGNEA
jgi:N6-adenosine-specific RNA methylase IME4